MKKLLPALLLCLPLVTVAASEEDMHRSICQKLIQGGTFFVNYERTCQLSSRVTDKIAQNMAGLQCLQTFGMPQADAWSKEEQSNFIRVFNSYNDKNAFCSDNLQDYINTEKMMDEIGKNIR